jgi:outer membrane protein OmpA-like peptidoglycan-associated protein
MERTSKLCLSSLVFIGLAGCSMQANPALDRAQVDMREAKNNPMLAERSPTLLVEAASLLDRAEQSWHYKRDREEVDHLVYMTERTLAIAREESRRKGSLADSETQRERAQFAALDLRNASSEANARARMSGELLESSRAASDANRELIRELSQKVSAIQTRETERGLVLTLSDDVLFESGRAELKPGARLKLSAIGRFLQDHPERRAVVEGHTDSTGTFAENRELSQRRADSVRAQLLQEGAEPSQIQSKGMGQEFPLASNNSQAGRLQNRRVQILLSSQEG